MKNNKRIAMVAILLIIAVVAVSAAPLMRNRQATVQQPVAQARQAAVQTRQGAMTSSSTQAVQQRQMLQEQALRDEVLAQVPEELKALIEARRAEAAERQEAQRSEAVGQGFRGRSKGSMNVR